MSSFFKDKVVIITGGTDGIGRAIVELMIDHGAKVSTCGRNHDKLYQLQRLHPSSYLHTMVADVSHEHDCKRLIELTVKMFGTIDILINNAGITMRAEVEESSLDVLKQVMDVNFFGSVYCTKFALPYIIKEKGTIVGISSIAGYRGLPGRSGYSASKHALQGWMESLRTEMMGSGVNVMWVCPGYTTSNIRNAALNKSGEAQGESPMDEDKMMSAEKCAHKIIKAIVKKKRNLVMTFQGKQTVFLNRVFPKLTDRLVRNFYYKNGKLVK